ncbi:Cytochrome c553 [Luteibacter sp. UNCMF331Sha3.1]|uniref:c-type cytochrome n=1 Tax=Luteibacter sp. UNCMF331Sha3.1 TaxID=1502760 RepID=UPI0008ACD0BC|nr:c-type cytochrome [Luteibacter sp. UNCMF331Sha3.1]SEM16175.1 Cytochrome c553 [Luteibacter sp. UNCMF331Sha3.1]
MRRLLRRLVVVAAVLCTASAAASDASAVPDTLAQRIAACTACHGEHGEGGDNGFNPRLAGKPAGYLVRQMQDFRRGLRHYDVMEYMVAPLTDEYMHEIAAYFAAQDVPYATHPVPSTTPAAMARGEQLATRGDPARGVPACMACHGTALTGVEPDIPGLVGLPYDYVSAQLGSWRTNTRSTVEPDCMATVVGRLTDADISAVSAWLAQRPVPADVHAAPAGSVTPPLRCGVLGASR